MAPPKLLPPSDLERIHAHSPDAAVQYLQNWLELKTHYDRALVEQILDEIANSRHKRLYGILSVLLGTFLATFSLGVCLYGIHEGSNLFALAAMLAPVSGLAGVFVWGYRPREKSRSSSRDVHNS
jgi:hypothetical protein